MTKASEELLRLAARCEAAAGPDEKLDAEIVRAIGFKYRVRQYSIGLTYGKDWDRYTAREWVRGDETLADVPAYTASLDAAMTLYLRVPERVPSNPRLAAAEGLRQRADAA